MTEGLSNSFEWDNAELEIVLNLRVSVHSRRRVNHNLPAVT
jgi:hypothetical protein